MQQILFSRNQWLEEDVTDSYDTEVAQNEAHCIYIPTW